MLLIVSTGRKNRVADNLKGSPKLTKHAFKKRHAILRQVLTALDCNNSDIPEDRPKLATQSSSLSYT